MNTTTCTCETCGISFEKPTNEYKRSLSVGRKLYCSRSCAAKTDTKRANLNTSYDISKYAGNLRDEYTGFREFIRRAKGRGKLGNLTIEYLKEVWDNQEGICPYSGVQLVLPGLKGKHNKIYVASVDRIDSSLPYERGNIQFISAAMNMMKGELSHEETLSLCRIIAQNHCASR